jgi:hypothetical protein
VILSTNKEDINFDILIIINKHGGEMSGESDAIQIFIDKKRQELETDVLSRDELKALALKLLGLYEGEIIGKEGVSTEDGPVYKDDDFDEQNDEEF